MMLTEILRWNDKIKEGFSLAQGFYRDYQTLLPKEVKRIVFVGMGGSGIAGQITKTLLDRSSNVHSIVIDGPTIPHWLDPSTLAIICSYSGNTWETLEAFTILRQYAIPCIVLTHGGELEKLATIGSIPLALLPTSLTPRSALGNFLGFFMGIIDKMGIFNGRITLEHWMRHTDSYISRFSDVSFFDEFLTLMQHQEQAIVWGVTQDSQSASYRATTQLNENSKLFALHTIFPELCHNLLEGCSSLENKPPIIVFHTNFVSKSLITNLAATGLVLKERGINLYKPPVFGDNFQEQLFNIILWSDFASVYLGRVRGVDTIQVPLIQALKDKQRKMGVVGEVCL